MIYQLERIKADVRACMDQDRTSAELVTEGDMDVLMLDKVIESKIVEAVERVECAADYRLLEQGHTFSAAALHPEDQGSGWLLLPDDFMRLVVFEMSDWERPVYTAIGTGDPLYARQRCRVAALRGTPQRPVCAIGVRPVGLVLEYYASRAAEPTISRAVYIPHPQIDEDGGVDISERCYTAVVYTCAGLVYTSTGDKESAAAMYETAKTYLTTM